MASAALGRMAMVLATNCTPCGPKPRTAIWPVGTRLISPVSSPHQMMAAGPGMAQKVHYGTAAYCTAITVIAVITLSLPPRRESPVRARLVQQETISAP